MEKKNETNQIAGAISEIQIHVFASGMKETHDKNTIPPKRLSDKRFEDNESGDNVDPQS